MNRLEKARTAHKTKRRQGACASREAKKEEEERSGLFLAGTANGFHVVVSKLEPCYVIPARHWKSETVRLSQHVRERRSLEMYWKFTEKLECGPARPLNLPQNCFQTSSTHVSSSNETGAVMLY
jgi:hypothetical protein